MERIPPTTGYFPRLTVVALLACRSFFALSSSRPVLMSEATASRIASLFDIEDLGEQRFKNVGKPIRPNGRTARLSQATPM